MEAAHEHEYLQLKQERNERIKRLDELISDMDREGLYIGDYEIMLGEMELDRVSVSNIDTFLNEANDVLKKLQPLLEKLLQMPNKYMSENRIKNGHIQSSGKRSKTQDETK